MSEVIKNKLYLGNTVDLNNLNYLQEKNITSIICLTQNIVVKQPVNLYAKTHMYSFPNSFSINIKPYFNEILNCIENELEHNSGKVLVCCANGFNTSVTIIVAYLMWHYDMNLIDALRFIKVKRGQIYLSISYVEQLCEYELELFGKSSGTFNDIKNIIYARV